MSTNKKNNNRRNYYKDHKVSNVVSKSTLNNIIYYVCIIIISIYVFIVLTQLINNNNDDKNNNNDNINENIVFNNGDDNIIGFTHIGVNDNMDNNNNDDDCLYTYMQLTDGTFNYLYGILAIHGALIRTKSKYSHNIMLMPNVSRKQIELFNHLGIGTYKIDGSSMDPYLSKCGNCWTVTFYKLFIFNMTKFDKILYIDADVGIMHYNGIDELFKHPTPSAVSDRGGNHFELNGGVLLIQPNNKLFKTILNNLPNVRNAKQLNDEAKERGEASPFIDNWNSEWRDYCGDQGFLNAFFNSNTTNYGPFYSLHYRYGLLTSSFSNEWQRYLLQHRPYILKNVHFTVWKPWHQDGLNRFRQITDNIAKLNARGLKAGYQDEIMSRFFVRYWLDIKIALEKCGTFCKRHFPGFQIPDDVDKFLKIRPEPFTCYEKKLEYISNDQFQSKYKGSKCSK